MSAYKDTKQGTWYVSFRYIDWTGKKTQKLKRGFKTKKEALNYEKEFMRKTAADMKMEMGSFIEVYFEDKRKELKENSIRNKQHMMNKHIVPYFETRKMNEITPADVIQWQNTIQEKGYSKTYERMIQNQLNALFNHAQKIYNLKENPCKKVKRMGKSDADKLEFWTKEEYERFITVIDPGSEDYLIFEILFWTGIREGELLALSFSDFDMSGNRLHINKTYNRIQKRDVIDTPKTENSVRTIDIPNFLKEEVQEYVKKRYGFPENQRLFPIVARTLQKRLKRYEKQSGVKQIRVHDIRHSHVAYLHIDFVPYMTNWKGKGMDTRVSLKQALKSLGFQGGNKHDTELNQWINHEKEVLAEIAKQHGIEWEQKGTHEEHLDVYNFKKKERKKEVQELEQEKENLTVENEGLTSQIAEARADIKLLEEEKIQFQKDKEIAEKRAEKAETELKKLEDRREFLQPVMDNVSKEIKEYGMIKTFLPEATTLERAVTYRDKKIKPLFIEMKNKIGAMAAQVKELTRERDSWKSKFQKKKQEHEKTKKELAEVQKDYQKLSGEKEILQGIADRYNRLLRMLGKDMVERLVQDDIRMQTELEAKKRKEQMLKKIGDRIQWARERSEEHNAKIKKNKAKYRGMEL